MSANYLCPFETVWTGEVRKLRGCDQARTAGARLKFAIAVAGEIESAH
jgi:hypothetical protein